MRTTAMLSLLFVAFVTAGYAPGGAANAEQRQSILILAAASTTDALEEVLREFEAANPGVEVHTSFGASSTLAQQIVHGVRADVFLSASTQWADLLDAKQLVAARVDLLGNRLVVIVPADSKLEIASPEDLATETVQRLALADPAAVPAGVYARDALEQLGVWRQLAPRVAAGADVRQALHFVATGAAEAGIVYASDVAVQDQVRIACEFPEELSRNVRYPLVLLKGAKPEAAGLFEFLQSPAAMRAFERHGFRGLASARPPAPLDRAGGGAADRKPAEEIARASGWLSEPERQALRLSLQVGVCAVLVSLPLAIAAGYLLARPGWGGKWLVELLVNLPLVLPPVVTGYLLLVLLAPRGPLGSRLENWFGVQIVATWIGAALAAAVVSFPLMVRAIRLAFQSIDPRLEMAARSLGATRARAFWTVSLPLARRGVLAGCILAFARSLGEFGATIMVAGNIVGETQTIPLAIFSSANRPGGEPEVWRLVVLSIVLAAVALAVSEWLERRHAAREAA